MDELFDDLAHLIDAEPDQDMEAEVLFGLGLSPRRLPSKYFYDERGSKLFDLITRTPEYYPTRTELAIMHAHVGEMARLIGPRASLIELGSGSSTKTRILLQNLVELAAYVPVDISCQHLKEAAAEVAAEFQAIEVLPVCADFTQPFDLPSPRVMPERNIVYFPGSTIGNFDGTFAQTLLRNIAGEAKDGGGLLIGVDLRKDAAVLEAAYNDAAGVTAAFNKNILRHINDKLDADFDLDAFRHRAIWNDERGRIEMHLISLVDQEVSVADETFSFAAGEAIITEFSHKYTPEGFAILARSAGFEREAMWLDDEQLFSVQYFVCTGASAP